MNTNLADIADPNQPAPEGEYPMQCESVEATHSSAKGEEMLAFQHIIAGTGEDAGKRVFDYVMLEGKGASFGLFKIRQLSEACGVNLKKTSVANIYEDPMKYFAGKTFTAYLGIRIGEGEYAGRDSNTVERVLP